MVQGAAHTWGRSGQSLSWSITCRAGHMLMPESVLHGWGNNKVFPQALTIANLNIRMLYQRWSCWGEPCL